MHRFVRLASLYTRVFYYKNSYVGRFSHLYYPGDKPYGTLVFGVWFLTKPISLWNGKVLAKKYACASRTHTHTYI